LILLKGSVDAALALKATLDKFFIWDSYAPPRVKFFVWLAGFTGDKL
jgi:hypothetical protein